MKIYGLSNLRLSFLRIIRVNDLRDIKVLVKICTDTRIAGQYHLVGTAMGIVPLSGGPKFLRHIYKANKPF